MKIKKISPLVTLFILSSLVVTPFPLKADPLGEPTPNLTEKHATNAIPNYNLMQLVKGSGPEVFLIQDGERRWITDAKTFDAYGFNYSEVNQIFDEELNNYSEGTPITKNGTLLRGIDSDKIYIIINGSRRLVRARVFDKHQFQREDINCVTESYLLSIPEGPVFR
ncbi:MAG: hypothetical protein Fur006_44550 [Coleofasciculaceae cyanobacterium]